MAVVFLQATEFAPVSETVCGGRARPVFKELGRVLGVVSLLLLTIQLIFIVN